MDCWKCKWHRRIAGDVHIKCAHPEAEKLKAATINEVLLRVFAGWEIVPLIPKDFALKIKLDPIGIKRGWANWPWNFDPIWVEECSGFEEKEEEKE
ncbi:MAG: hypothetical protein ACTSPL_04225 [Candidatus Odinarchaeia archaeon]